MTRDKQAHGRALRKKTGRVRIVDLMTGAYWQCRYKLLAHYRTRVLSESHARLIAEHQALICGLHLWSRSGEIQPEMKRALSEGFETIERAAAIQKAHGYKGESNA